MKLYKKYWMQIHFFWIPSQWIISNCITPFFTLISLFHQLALIGTIANLIFRQCIVQEMKHTCKGNAFKSKGIIHQRHTTAALRDWGSKSNYKNHLTNAKEWAFHVLLTISITTVRLSMFWTVLIFESVWSFLLKRDFKISYKHWYVSLLQACSEIALFHGFSLVRGKPNALHSITPNKT